MHHYDAELTLLATSEDIDKVLHVGQGLRVRVAGIDKTERRITVAVVKDE